MPIVLQPTAFMLIPHPVDKDGDLTESLSNGDLLRKIFGDIDVERVENAQPETAVSGASSIDFNGQKATIAISVASINDDRLLLSDVVAGQDFRIKLKDSGDSVIVSAAVSSLNHYLHDLKLPEVGDGIVIACRDIASKAGLSLMTSSTFHDFVAEFGLFFISDSDAVDLSEMGYVMSYGVENSPQDIKAESIEQIIKPLLDSVKACAENVIKEMQEMIAVISKT